MILIDAHGGTHGLRVEIDHGEVSVYQWGELDDPDENGDYRQRIQSMTMTTRECLEHAANGWRRYDSQRDRVIAGALDCLATYGGEESDVDGRPCDHFGQYWGPLHLPYGLTRGEYDRNLTCGGCGVKPSHDSGDAMGFPPV